VENWGFLCMTHQAPSQLAWMQFNK
jgi:hypothetical protein